MIEEFLFFKSCVPSGRDAEGEQFRFAGGATDLEAERIPFFGGRFPFLSVALGKLRQGGAHGLAGHFQNHIAASETAFFGPSLFENGQYPQGIRTGDHA